MNIKYKTFVDMATVCFDLKDYQGALEYSTQALKYDNIGRDAYFISGMSNYHLENYSNATDDLESFLMVTKFSDTDMRIFESNYILANCYYKLKKVKQSVMRYNECINKFLFSESDYDYIQKKKIAKENVIKLEIERGSKLLSDSGLINILTERDDKHFWEIILMEYDFYSNGLEEGGFEGKDLIFIISSNMSDVASDDKIIREEWFFEKSGDSKYNPTKNRTGFDNDNYRVISIQRPSIDVKTVSGSFSRYYNGSVKSLESSDWIKDEDGLWQKSEKSGSVFLIG